MPRSLLHPLQRDLTVALGVSLPRNSYGASA